MTRVAAWSVLRSGNPAPLREVPRACEDRGLDGRDAALVRRLVGTEVRRRGTLRALVRKYVRGKPKPDLAAHLHLGMVQILFLDRIPDHAAVSATIGAVEETLGRSKVPLVNGTLRNVIRARREGQCGDPTRDIEGRNLYLTQPAFRDPEKHPLLWAEDILSIPANLLKGWEKRMGREAAWALARHFLEEPALVVRGVDCDREGLRTLLTELEVETTDGHHPDTLRVASADTAAVTSSDAFYEGRFTIQGESALAAAQLVQAQPGERILDLCSAPGGKTAVLAGEGAHVTAVDVHQGRLGFARATCERLNCGQHVEFVVSDGTDELLDDGFDAALVDAPCSNTGVLGARPGARWRFGPGTLRELNALQRRLLVQGAARVRAGGRLVWSTCSLEPEENGRLVRAFLEEHSAWELEEEHEAIPGDGGPLDGGYAARLRRT